MSNNAYHQSRTSGVFGGTISLIIVAAIADADLFELGIEPLQVIALSKQINAYSKRYIPNTKHITAEIMWAHSALKDLDSREDSSKSRQTC